VQFSLFARVHVLRGGEVFNPKMTVGVEKKSVPNINGCYF
jgi:hypothetical protein